MSVLRRLASLARMLGLDPSKGWAAIRGVPAFLRDWRIYQGMLRASERESGSWRLGKLYPCLTDRRDASGSAAGAYFHQDLYVAQRICSASPKRHVDVASRVDGFVAHVASFRPVEVIDIRPLGVRVPNITFRQVDLMRLPPDLLSCSDSVSCLHALEHFGLGRYGDPLDPEGHLKGFASLSAMVRPGGRLYLSVPIGPQRIEFNAHRVFSIRTVLDISRGDFEVEHFSFVDDAGAMHADVAMTAQLLASEADCLYGCGIFVLRRRSVP